MTALIVKIITSRINVRIIRGNRQPRIRNSTRSQRIINIRRPVTRPVHLPLNGRFNITLSSYPRRHRMQLQLFRTLKRIRYRSIFTRNLLLLNALNMMRMFGIARARITQHRTRSRHHPLLFFTPRKYTKTSCTRHTTTQSTRYIRHF